MGAAPTLSDRTLCLYELIVQAADANMETPTESLLATGLALRGHRISRNRGMFSWEIKRLVEGGKIRVEHQGARRIFEIVATGHRTRARASGPTLNAVNNMMQAVAARRADLATWPKPSPGSAEAYEDAVRRRLFALHEVRPRVRQTTWPHGAVRQSGDAVRSLTGCSAVMDSQ